MELLDPLPHQKLFVADSHRPLDVYNVYNATDQVRLLANLEGEEELPPYEHLFREVRKRCGAVLSKEGCFKGKKMIICSLFDLVHHIASIHLSLDCLGEMSRIVINGDILYTRALVRL